MIGTLAVSKRLQDAGIPPSHANALAEEFSTYAEAGEVATKADLRELKGEMVQFKTELRGEMNALKSELRIEMSDLKTKLRTEMAGVKSELVILRFIGGFIAVGMVALLIKIFVP